MHLKVLDQIKNTTDFETYSKVVKFVMDMQVTKSQNTINSYLFDLHIGLRFFNAQHINTWGQLSTLNLLDFRSLCAEGYKNNRSIASQQRLVVVWKSFFKFHNLLNLTEFRTPKIPKRLPRPVPNEMIEQISRWKPDKWTSMRDQALWLLMYYSGMRISEALSLKISQINDKAVIIKGKGDKKRLIPILPKAFGYISAYLKHRPMQNEYVFISSSGKAISQKDAAHTFRRWRENMRFPDYITLHSFRHGFATTLLKKDAPLTAIQKLLGHQNLSTTSQYIEICDKQLEDSFKKYYK